MKYSCIKISIAVWLISACLASAELVWKDSFALGEGRIAGAPLSGLKLEQGDAIWQGDKGVVLSESGDVTLEGLKGGSLWFPLEGEPETIRVEAEIAPVGSDWTALALGGKWGSAFYDTTAIWVMLKPSGDFQVRAQGTKLLLKTGKIPRYASAGNRVVLSYERAGNSLSVEINGEAVLERYALGQKQFTPTITNVGFKFNGPITGEKRPAVRDFQVVMKSVPMVTMSLNQPLAVYAPGEAIQLGLSAAGISNGEWKVRVSLTDFYGHLVFNEEVTADGHGGKWRLDLPVRDPGRMGYFLARAELSDKSGSVLASAERSLAVIPLPSGKTNVFGAMVYPHLSYPFPDKERDAQYMKRIGITFVRSTRLNWVHAQSSKEAPFVWTSLDQEVEMYDRLGLKIIATTGWPTPSWASPATAREGVDRGNFLPRQDCMPQAKQFVREMAMRYRGKVVCYEIGNEVDAYFWLGSLDHYLAHDTAGIVKDYCDYFSTLATEIRAGDPQVLVAPSTTSHMPDGHMYHPWLKLALDNGLGSAMSAFCPHYEVDLAAVNSLLHEYKTEKPMYITEVGGIARNSVEVDPQSDSIKQIIRGDYLQMSRLLAYPNVKALCKFLFREQSTYGGEGRILAGLLGVNFEVRPTYVAYATLIRYLSGAAYQRELNITREVSTGWLQGSSFSRDGQIVNILFLHATAKATVTLGTKESSLKMVDVMGNETVLVAKDGRVSFEMSKSLPMLVLGRIEDKPGAIQRPTDKLVREIEIPLENPGFEAGTASVGKIPGWKLMVNEDGAGSVRGSGFTVSPDRSVVNQGEQSVRYDATEMTQWFGIMQEIPLSMVPQPGPDEYITFKVSMKVKGEKVNGKGMGYTLAFRKSNMTRLYFTGSPYFGFGSTFDWKELSGTHTLREWIPGTDRITLDLLMGKATGTLWIDDVKVTVQLWKTAN